MYTVAYNTITFSTNKRILIHNFSEESRESILLFSKSVLSTFHFIGNTNKTTTQVG